MLSRNLSRASVGGMRGVTVAAALTMAAAAEAASPSGSSSGGAIQSATDCVYVIANPGKASGQGVRGLRGHEEPDRPVRNRAFPTATA